VRKKFLSLLLAIRVCRVIHESLIPEFASPELTHVGERDIIFFIMNENSGSVNNAHGDKQAICESDSWTMFSSLLDTLK